MDKLAFLPQKYKFKILILEDSPNRQEAFLERFSGSLFAVTICEHAQECISLLKKDEYEVVFLDHDLNGKFIDFDKYDCGTVVAEWINKNPISAQIVIHSLNIKAVRNMQRLLPDSMHLPLIWEEDNFKKRMKLFGLRGNYSDI
ncbi:MAG: hypothetical protein JEY94_14085 [Melioribacteraceae bacterium]|nr:hypothetical protein [Melioribacteraceae bacterium]